MAASNTQPQVHLLRYDGQEEACRTRLDELAGDRFFVTHDRRVPAGRESINHLAVTPGGVFVIDAKYFSGGLDKRNVGSIFRPDLRLYVGDRDCTTLVHDVEAQAEKVRDLLKIAGFADAPVRGVLCFIDAEWGFFGSPFKLGNVLVTHPKFLYRVLLKESDIATSAIQDAARVLATVLPPA
jgi:hypothetical protein